MYKKKINKDKDSTVHTTEYRSKRNPTVKPRWVRHQTQRHSGGTIIESEVQPASTQLQRKAKLLTVIWLTTKHAVYRNTLLLQRILY